MSPADFFLEFLPRVFQTLLFLQSQDKPGEGDYLEVSKAEKRKKNAGRLFSWIIFHIQSKLYFAFSVKIEFTKIPSR